MLKWILLVMLLLAFATLVGILLWLQTEATFRKEIGQPAGKRALILYHPSRDANFSDELTQAMRAAFQGAGLAADRWTITRETPATPNGYEIIAIVSNTFFGAPDWPTVRYLKRARFDGQMVIAIMAGSGSTERAERTLRKLLDHTGANSIKVRSLWTMRPNQPGFDGPRNRQLALRFAREFAREASAPIVLSEAAAQQLPSGAAALPRRSTRARQATRNLGS